MVKQVEWPWHTEKILKGQEFMHFFQEEPMKNSRQKSIVDYGWIETMPHIQKSSFKKLQIIKEKKRENNKNFEALVKERKIHSS